KSEGVLTLTVRGAHAPMMQHIAPEIVEWVNRFFGYAAVARLQIRQGDIAKPVPRSAPVVREPVSAEIGQGLKAIADPELRAVLHDRMIKSGKVSLEYRHLIRDRLDLGAAVMARCAGPARFDGNSHAIFAAQETWIKRVVDWQAAHPEAAQQPALDQLRALVK